MEEATEHNLSMPVPEDMKGPLVMDMLATFWLSTVLDFIKKVGTEDAMQIMGPTLERIGVAKAESMMKMMPPLEKNAYGLAAWTNTWEEMMGIEGYIESASPEKVVKVNTKCPFSEGGSEVMCDLLTCSLKGAANVISPGYFIHMTHKMTSGDSMCRWVVEKKG
jgi:predicted ArsR family transcriptional regulator